MVILKMNLSTSTFDYNSTEPIHKIDRWIFRLLLLFIATMPLIIFGRFEYIVSPTISDLSLLGSGYKIEFFSHYKFFWTLLITAIVLMLFIYKLFFKQATISKTYLNIFLLLFIIAIIVSTVFSNSVHIALYGLYNRSDGAIAWICYIVLFFIALQIRLPKHFLHAIMYAFIPFTLINFFIMTMNFYDHDLFQNHAVYNFLVYSLPTAFLPNSNSQLLGTLDQWNYLSGMFAMVMVMYFVWAITAKGKVHVIIGSIIASLAMLIVFLSTSTSGFLTIVVCTPFILWILFKQKNKGNTVLVLSIFFIICTPVYFLWNSQEPKIYQESFGLVGSLLASKEKQASSNDSPIPSNDYLPVLPESSISGGSGRVYIWEKTIDLIKERPLTGYGMDTIMYYFPHYNIDAREGLRSEHTIVDKPHNAYLATFYGFGVIGFICFSFLGLFTVFTLIRSIYYQNWVTTTLTIFTFAYFIQAIFNDSLVAMTALAFLFIGISASQFLRKDQKSFIEATG